MSIPKEPRQIMINLMYLVLTAMLALNITKEVLTAFETIDNSIQKSSNTIIGKNNEFYAAFDKAEQNPSERDKVKKWNDKAKLIKAESQKVFDELQGYKDLVITTSGGYDERNGAKELHAMDDINTPTMLFVEQKKGDEVRKRLSDYVNFILGQIEKPEDKERLGKEIPVQMKDLPKTEENPSGDWSFGTFHNIPVIASVAMFSKFQNDVKNTESMMLNYLSEQVHLEDFKFDALTAIAVPTTSYALEGQDIEATIMLAAYNKSANPKISGGNVTVKDGVGIMKFKASGAGAHTINGVITIDKAGEVKSYPYKFEYMVGTAGASLQLDQMNVMYIGVPNPMTLSASGYNIEDVSLSLPGASLKATGKGTYEAAVTKQGTLDYVINAKSRTGQIVKVGGGKIRVKRIPDPTAMIGSRPVAFMPANEAKAQQGIIAKLDNFDFNAKFTVTSFQFVWIPKVGDAVPVQVKGNAFSSSRDCMQLINRSRPGDKWLIENVKAVGPDGTSRSINSVSITLN